MKLLAFILLLCLCGNVWHVHTLKAGEIVNASDSFPWKRTDLLPIYVGTGIALHRHDPYSASVVQTIDQQYYGHTLSAGEAIARDNMGFAYPLPIVLLFAPFAALPWKTACSLYFLLSLLSTILIAMIWPRVLGIRLPRPSLAILLLATLACWPTLWALRLENIVLSVSASVALGLYALQRDHRVAAGILVSLSSLKPQVSLLLVVWLILWAISTRQRRFLASFTATSLLLLAGSFALLPRWISDWQEGLIQYQRYTRVRPILPLPLAAGLALTLAFVLFRNRNSAANSQAFRVSVAVCLSGMLSIAPFSWTHTYDYILLAPACLLVLLYTPVGQIGTMLRAASLFFIALEFLLGPLASVLGASLGYSPLLKALPGLNVFLPLSLTVTLLFVWSGQSRQELLTGSTPSECYFTVNETGVDLI